MDSLRVSGKRRTRLRRPIAHGDDIVETIAAESIQVFREEIGSIDVEPGPQYLQRHRVDVRFRTAAALKTSARPRDNFLKSASAICERAELPVHKNSTRRRSMD